MASYDVSGKVALVTGAARGIGFETAKLLHAKGASVAVLDLDEGATEDAARQIGERALPIAADVTDRDAMSAAVDRTVERFGGLDLPIANAGIAPPTTTARTMDLEAFERVVDIDLYGVWRTVRPALPHVVERGGQVVVISSVYAWANGALNAPYAVSKAGVEALGRALRTELAPLGASALVAHFGFIDTAMVQDAYDDPLVQELDVLLPAVLRKRLTPAQAAAALVAGIEKRAPRVIVPKRWYAGYWLRGVLNPVLDAAVIRDKRMVDLLRRADAADRATLRGGMDRTAARAVDRTRVP